MSDTGSVTIPLYHCLFGVDGESITHWATTFEAGLYEALPHLYLISISDNSASRRRIVGAFMVKTSRFHDEEGFPEAMNLAAQQLEQLRTLLGPSTSMLPARLSSQGVPDETDFLRLAIQQFTKFSVGGHA